MARGVAARELGIEATSFLDPDDLTADVAGTRITLSKLEFGVLRALDERRGLPVSRGRSHRIGLGTSYAGGSNVVDVVVRGLRRKLGDWLRAPARHYPVRVVYFAVCALLTCE